MGLERGVALLVDDQHYGGWIDIGQARPQCLCTDHEQADEPA
jgi:hypothetical protein